MKKRNLSLAVILVIMLHVVQLQASEAAPAMPPDEVVSRLKEGNDRYVAGIPHHPNQNQERRTLTRSQGQHPYATVLSCSDSRVPVEILFDKGLGELFVVRVAGNVVNVDEAGSIEYGIDHLGTPVLVILGHTHCGAVTAVAQNVEVHGNIPPLIDNIKPAVQSVKSKHPELGGEALVEEAVRTNVWQAIDDLFKSSQVTRARVKEGKLKVIGAVYDIETGKVEWMGSHPDQDQLIKR